MKLAKSSPLNAKYLLLWSIVSSVLQMQCTFLCHCLQEINSCFFSNFLELNSDETEVLLIGSKSTLVKANSFSFTFTISNSSVSPYL